MAGANEMKQHISIEERDRWNKVVADFAAHLGAGGDDNHRLGDGSIPGFSLNSFTNEEKEKLAGIQAGALNNPHPETHNWDMITGLSVVGHTGEYKDLLNIPTTFFAEGGNCDTIDGIRITININPPENPINNKEIWFDTGNMLVKTYLNNSWAAFCAIYG